MLDQSIFDEHIKIFASTISDQMLGVVDYAPENWALPTQCISNVDSKVQRDGGRRQFAWMFHIRRVAHIPGPGYIIAAHHALWHAPNGKLVDITPIHHEPIHQPVMFKGSVLILIDDKALPIQIKNYLIPLKSRFYAMSHEQAMIEHVVMLTSKEEAEYNQMCESLS